MEFVYPYTVHNTTYYYYEDAEPVEFFIDASQLLQNVKNDFTEFIYYDNNFNLIQDPQKPYKQKHHKKQQFFDTTNTAEEENSTPIKLVPPEISYERDELLKLAERPLRHESKWIFLYAIESLEEGNQY